MGVEEGRSNMMGFCKICPICNGKACAGQIPGMGGTETGQSFINNVQALQGIQVRMKVLYDSETPPDTRTRLLGMDLAFPVLAAPIGGVRFNMAKNVDEATYCEALAKGCLSAGILPCFGDGAKDFVLEAGVKALAAHGGRGIPFIKPWADEDYLRKVDWLEGLGVQAIGMDIDALGLANVKFGGGSIPLRRNSQLAQLIAKLPYPLIVKGVMDLQEAQALVDMGAAAIVVSNHGGRILDSSPGTATVLPEIVAQLKGQVPVLVDGGIQSGLDVFKMLALGADAVLIGRGFGKAVLSDLDKGAANYAENIQEQLAKAMMMTGCRNIKEISRDLLYR